MNTATVCCIQEPCKYIYKFKKGWLLCENFKVAIIYLLRAWHISYSYIASYLLSDGFSDSADSFVIIDFSLSTAFCATSYAFLENQIKRMCLIYLDSYFLLLLLT